MKSVSRILLLLLLTAPAYSQDVEMADTLRAEGKIYVVVSILLVIFAGLIVFLVMMDRKASRLEKKLNENKPR